MLYGTDHNTFCAVQVGVNFLIFAKFVISFVPRNIKFIGPSIAPLPTYRYEYFCHPTCAYSIHEQLSIIRSRELFLDDVSVLTYAAA